MSIAFCKAEYDKWLITPLWSISQGLQLLEGFEPKARLGEILERENHSLKRDVVKRLKDRLEIADKAVTAGILNGHYSTEHSLPKFQDFEPREFLSWSEKCGFDIPDQLADLRGVADLDADQQEAPVERRLDTRERKTLLRLVYALARDCGYDFRQPHKDAEQIEIAAGAAGLDVPPAKTIAEKLKAASSLHEEEQG